MSNTKQSLIEYQTKLDAFQVYLDASYQYDYPSEADQQEWDRLMDIVNRLTQEVNIEQESKK